MPQNFISCDREQAMLLPPSLRDWLPAEHLAWFMLDPVEQMDLRAFYSAYRADGHGRAAHDPDEQRECRGAIGSRLLRWQSDSAAKLGRVSQVL